MPTPDVRATWDDGSFDKDIPGWVECLVFLEQEGDRVRLTRPGSVWEGTVGPVLPRAGRVRLDFDRGPLYFSLAGRRCLQTPATLSVRADLQPDVSEARTWAGLANAVARAVGGPAVVSPDSFDLTQARPHGAGTRLECRWSAEGVGLEGVVDLRPDGYRWASFVARGPRGRAQSGYGGDSPLSVFLQAPPELHEEMLADFEAGLGLGPVAFTET